MKAKLVLVTTMIAIAFISGVGTSSGLAPKPDSILETDSVVAATENNKVLYENDHIRLIEVTIRPGETEPFHTHMYPTAEIYDAVQPRSLYEVPGRGEFRLDRNFAPMSSTQQGRLPSELTKQMKTGWTDEIPVVSASPRNPIEHRVTNIDIFTYHYYRLEFKRIDGNGSMDAATKAKETLKK
jgi:hypothetical protein